MLSPKLYDVIINGGGPVGVGLAIELGQRGHRVAVVEKHLQPQPIPKGQNLTQRSVEHFNAWGCEAELRSAYVLPEGSGIGGMTSYGTLLSGLNYDWLNRARVAKFYFTANARLPQYSTEAVLRQRASCIPEIDLYYGYEGVGLKQSDTHVNFEIMNRENQQLHNLEGQYLVGADGSKSLVRSQAKIDEQVAPYNKLMALVVFRSTELHDLLKVYPGKAFYNVLHPDFKGYWQFFGRVDHGTTWFFHAPVPLGTKADAHDFVAMLHKAVGQDFGLEIDYVGFWDLRIAYSKEYRKNRIFVAGDAAHSHPPYGGYGINTGFEDARNLGWKLSAVLQGWGGDALLDSYDSERRPVFQSTARDFIEKFVDEDQRFLDSFTPESTSNFAELWQDRNSGADEVFAFEPNYQGSSVVQKGPGEPSAMGHHITKAEAGHHLSPQPLLGDITMFEALVADFTLLCDGSHPQAVANYVTAARELNIPLTVVDSLSPEAVAAYETDHILLRPDHYIAVTGLDVGPTAALRRAVGLAC